jgi:hypothetical protein
MRLDKTLLLFGIPVAMLLVMSLYTTAELKIAVAQVPAAVCPATNVHHWDKIVFSITSALAKRVNLTANTELDIKVLDDPTKVADIKQKVLNFLHVPNIPAFRNSTKIIDVDYAIICATNSTR